MIEPTLADIGRRVIYRSPGGETVEQGTITSFNEQFVFVRSRNAGPTSAATRREDSVEALWRKRLMALH